MIQSPYQQNIDMMKEFFKKPIVLLLSIFTFLSFCFCAAAIALSHTILYLPGIFTLAADCINIFYLLFAIAFLLFFVNSKKAESKLSVPSGMFKSLSVISFILTIALLVFSIWLFVSIFIITPQNTPYLNDFFKLLTGVFKDSFINFIALYLLIISVVLVLDSLSVLFFANSVKKSLSTIYLRKNGAVFFAVLHFLFAAFKIYIIAILIFNALQGALGNHSPAYIALSVGQISVVTATNIIASILAVKYYAYINNISQKFRIEIPSPKDNAENINRTPEKVVNDSSVQPAPSFTNISGDNPYDTAQNTIPQTDIPQAPVREDFNTQPLIQEVPDDQMPLPDDVTETADKPELISSQENDEPKEAAAVEVEKEEKKTVPEKKKENNTPENKPEKYVPRFCSECGMPVNPGDNFCNNCGKEIIYDL